jgi:hypothetical protein
LRRRTAEMHVRRLAELRHRVSQQGKSLAAAERRAVKVRCNI